MKATPSLLIALSLLTSASCGGGEPFSIGEGGSSAGGTATTAGNGGSPEEAGAPSSSVGGEESVAGAPANTAGTSSGGEAPQGGAPSVVDCEQEPQNIACVPELPFTTQRLELPCVAESTTAQLCKSVAMCPMGGKLLSYSATLAGSPDVTYDITLRVRGVVEPRVYTGGTKVGDRFYVGGTPQQPSGYNAMSISVSAPAKTYYLNAADAKGEVYQIFNLDYTAVVSAKGGAKLTLQVTDPDCALVRNCQSFTGACQPYVPANVPPAPAAFNGQFVQLDLLSIAPAQ